MLLLPETVEGGMTAGVIRAMEEKMTILVSIIYVILGIALSALILMQESKQQGLGSIGGMADSYWGKIKGRSMEGSLEKFTKYGTGVFLVLALVLNLLMK